jgi:hypothetical protein
MALLSGMWTLSQVSQALQNGQWLGAPPKVEYLVVAGGGNGAETAGSGGSGIVIIRYPTLYRLDESTTGSPTQTTSNGYYIYTFTASGSITF